MQYPRLEVIKEFLWQQVKTSGAKVEDIFVASAIIASGQLSALQQFFLQNEISSSLPSELIEMALDSLYGRRQALRGKFKRVANLLQRIHAKRQAGVVEFLETVSTALETMDTPDDFLSSAAAWCLIMHGCQQTALSLNAENALFENQENSIPLHIRQLFLPLFEIE